MLTFEDKINQSKTLGPQSDKKIAPVYFKNLDALRFIAAFSVIIFHYSADIKGLYPNLAVHNSFSFLFSIAEKGSLGVNFFFVLSGFLITYLIFQERKNSGKFSLKKFLIRRTLRIWPLYFIVIIIGFILFPMIISGYETAHNPWMYVGFLANFDEINNGLNDSVNFLTSPWSVAVEEQFYLFWGFLITVLFALKKFSFPLVIGLLYALSFVFRTIYWEEERVIYYHTFAVCQDILTGAFIGWALFEGKTWLNKIQDYSKITVLIIYMIGIIICIFKNKLFPGELIIIERFVLSCFFGFIILDQIRGNHSVFKIGRIKAFNFLGKISYGLYMYHLIAMYLIFMWMNSWGTVGYWMALAYLFLTLASVVVVASISYFLIEKPLLKMKPK